MTKDAAFRFPKPEPFRFPKLDQRVSVIGKTGSGKTQFGAWLLSRARFDLQPYVIIDFKNEQLFHRCSRIIDIDFRTIPKKPGLYRLACGVSEDQQSALRSWLWRVWEHENIGLYFDEAYMLPREKGSPFEAILTQGRSKRIPAIILTQRPSWITRFVFTEADYFALFRLNDVRDLDTLKSFVPGGIDQTQLARYNCHWYDVQEDRVFVIRPVPDAETIAASIDARLKKKVWL